MSGRANNWGGRREGAGKPKGSPSPGSGRKKEGGGRKQVQISLSEERYARYKSAADERGLNFSAFLVDCVERVIPQ